MCEIEHRAESWRCNQAICDWADAPYPGLPKATARNRMRTGHDEVVLMAQDDAPVSVQKFNPAIPR
jgi:DNA helicase-2/ATP-dependent DNA helicase PcrA